MLIVHKPFGYSTQDPQFAELLNASHVVLTPLPDDVEGLVICGDKSKSLPPDTEYEYELSIDKSLTPDARVVLGKGMIRDGQSSYPITIVKEFNKGRRVIITFKIATTHDTALIRQMFETLGFNTSAFKRTRIGNVKLGVLPIGKTKELPGIN